MLLLKIFIGLAAVGLGIYIGRPARYDRTQEDLELALEEGRKQPQWTKRHFTPLDLLRKDSKGSERRRGGRSRFRTTHPKGSTSSSDNDSGPPQVRLG
ncbi:MAG: hypothetical protein ACR2QM_10600 [Longimicrobiales bacterium]